jgi:hypothetical protein
MRLVLFPGVHALMRAERLLEAVGIPFEVLPTPKEISRECGMCLGIDDGLEARVRAALRGVEHRMAAPPEAIP